MTKKGSANAAAVIELGANNVRMRISQMSKGKISSLDYLEYPVRLGHDVFETGSISFESLLELSSVLEKFSSAAQSYNIQKPKVISCSTLRDAKNRSLVVDQLRVRNNVDVTVLEDSEEKAYLYSEIIAALNSKVLLKKGNSVIAHVGSGTIGVAVFDGSKIIYFQNISMGALKLHDILHGMRNHSEDFHTVIEEYLDTLLNRVALGNMPIENLILTGSQIHLVAKLCEGKGEEDIYQFSTKHLSELYFSLRSLMPESISHRYGIGEDQAALLYTALSIYHAMVRFCPQAETVCAPASDICSAVIRCTLSPKANGERQEFWHSSALACAETTAQRFGCDPVHSQYILNASCHIFDKLKRIHGLDSSKRIILELASILHSCGSFVSARQHNKCTFELIKGMDLFGLPEASVLETASVAGSVANLLSVEEDPDLSYLSTHKRLVISKLSAIFRMANALDKSHREKLRDLKVSVEEDRVLFKVTASGDTLLEQWAFAQSAQFFKDVFGLSPELSVKFELM